MAARPAARSGGRACAAGKAAGAAAPAANTVSHPLQKNPDLHMHSPRLNLQSASQKHGQPQKHEEPHKHGHHQNMGKHHQNMGSLTCRDAASGSTLELSSGRPGGMFCRATAPAQQAGG